MDWREGPRPTVKDFEEIYDLRLNTKKEVCPVCRGEGEYVNPAIDGDGLSSNDECWQDDDFRENYFSGRYNVRCEECHGNNVIDAVDQFSNDPDTFAQWELYCQEIYEHRAEIDAERRAGC